MVKENKSQKMAQEIIESLENGTAPWIKPWTPEQSAVPHNPVTGTRYKGINFLYLSMQGKPDPRWVTFRQAQKNGWQIKRGSKGRTVQFWQFEKDQKTINAKGETVTQRVKLERPLLRHYYVFNASDVEGIPELAPKSNNEWERHDLAENILQRSGAAINHIKGDKAAYYPLTDSITLPERDQFGTPDKYYATALHELGHWTGHESRLNRPLSSVFGSHDYAREELRAEMASYMVGMQLGIGHDPGQHIAYINNWVKDLKDHPTEIFKACANAEKIQSYILDFGQEHNQEQTMSNKKSHYIITDDSFVGLTHERDFAADVQAGEAARFDNPSAALQAALAAKQTHAERLEGSELYIYRVDPPDDLQRDPVLTTGTPLEMRHIWHKNIGGEFPENILQDEVRAMPGMPESQANELTGKRFISFAAGPVLDSVGNINLDLQQALQRGTTVGVLRFENTLEKRFADREEITQREIKQAKASGYDGIVFVRDGRPVTAIATTEKQLLPGMYQAAKGLEKHYLAVPFADKDKAKQHGALWDKKEKSWYFPDGLNDTQFARWWPGQSTSITADNPHQQFAEVILEMGGQLPNATPEMDGKLHRIPETGGKPGNKNIAYIGYLDGVPAGWVKNFRGTERKWKMSGVVLTDEDRARLRKEGQEKKAQREKERQEIYTQKAKESKGITDKLSPATGNEKYFVDKGININPNVKIDPQGNIVVPMFDIDGKQWSHQTLQRNGFKQIFKDSRILGTFALVGTESVQALKGNDIFIAEGYSTAATIHAATGKPVVAAATSNNLKTVATALHDRYPDQDIYIMADDDQHLITQGKINAGQVKAKEAAEAVNGHVISPSFGNETVDKSRTDFNDMARVRGLASVKDYIRANVDLARSGHKIEQEKIKEQEQNHLRETAVELER